MRMLTVLIAVVLVAPPAAWAEMGVHWWPAGEAEWFPRYGHAAAAFNGSLWVFGGGFYQEIEGEGSWTYYSNEVWRSDDGIHWSHVGQFGGLPFYPRIGVAIKDGRLFLYGRYASGGAHRVVASNDGAEWELLTSSPPRGLRDAGIESFQGYLWVHRVFPDDSQLAFGRRAVWKSFNGRDWESVEPQGNYDTLTRDLVQFDGKLLALGNNSFENLTSNDGLGWAYAPAGESGYVDLFLYVVRPEISDGRLWVVATSGRTTPHPHRFNRIMYTKDASNWQIVAETLPFPARTGFATVAWNNRIWILGGYSFDPRGELLNDIWYTEDTPEDIHRADYDADGTMSLSELLRVIQFFQAGRYQCDGTTEDSYAPGTGWETCYPHSSDYNPQDWRIGLSELLRAVQFYNVGSYHYCPDAATEDGYCPGAG